MKFFIFAFVIAVIQQEYETFLSKPIEEYTPIECLPLFKKYALELVYAATQPFVINKDIMNGGCECMAGVRIAEEDLSAIDAILEIMSIAKNHHYELQVLRVLTDVSKHEFKGEFMEKLCKVLIVIERWSLHFEYLLLDDYFEPYFWKYKRGLSRAAPGTSAYDNTLEAGLKCYFTMSSMNKEYNDEFFKQLATGSYLVRVLMASEDDNPENDSRQIELNKIISSISAYELSNYDNSITRRAFVGYLESLGV